MTKQDQLKGLHRVNDYWICERLRYLIEVYGHADVKYYLMRTPSYFSYDRMLAVHIDNLTNTYTRDSVTYNWDQVFERAA